MATMTRILTTAALLAGLAGPALAASSDWTRFTSRQYGLTIDYPVGLVDDARSNPEKGQYILKRNAAMILSVDELHGASLRSFLDRSLLQGVDVTYRQSKGNWMAYSGYVGSDIVYGRTHVSCGGRFAHSFLIRYPRSERATYDKAVVRLSHSVRVDPGFVARSC
jgi:hypothetical protein